jgi:predicted nucleic acid-binding protein
MVDKLKGYLLDTNHVAAVCRKDRAICAKIEAFPPGTQVRANVITLGEVEAGHRITVTTNQKKRDEYVAELESRFLPEALGITVKTRFAYAEIMGRLWNNHRPPSSKVKTERWLVEKFAVDINDVWSVAVAWEHGLTFVTTDDMEEIRKVISDDEVSFECWLPKRQN